MNIRKKILIYYSSSIIFLITLTFLFVYLLFAEFRKDDFQKRQRDRITTTLSYLTEVKELEEQLIGSMDKVSIHKIYDEKLLIFNAQKKLIYSNIDDLKINAIQSYLQQLNRNNDFVERKEGLYDIIAIYVESNRRAYYGISKAYDFYGYKKLNFLAQVLIITWIAFVAIVITLAYYISMVVSKPIMAITNELQYVEADNSKTLEIAEGAYTEVKILAEQFNQLLAKLKKSYSFQKHTIHHISHELKTPIAILVSKFESMEGEMDVEKLHNFLQEQKLETKNLGDMINVLLDIARLESNQTDVPKSLIRVDELIFDIEAELEKIYPNFKFQINYSHNNFTEADVTIYGNALLLKTAFQNLMINCIKYSINKVSTITIESTNHQLNIYFKNDGPKISEDEEAFIFEHFFRGENSKGIKGHGLGLVLVSRILEFHRASIQYYTQEHLNVFQLQFPLNGV